MPYIRQSGAWVDVLNTAPSGGAASDLYPSSLIGDDVAAASSSRTAITATASATPHTAGSWVEIDASASADASGLFVFMSSTVNTSGADSSTLMEIGTGGSGAETVWVTLAIGYQSAARPMFVPGHIAAGTRIAMRVRSVTAGRSVSAWVSYLKAKTTTFGAPVTYGADTSTSRGTALTAPGSTNTKGAWTAIGGTTSVATSALIVCPQGNGGASMNGSGVLIDIGVDPAGGSSYAVVAADIYLLGSATELYNALSPTTYGVDIPAGSNIAARYARANANNAVDLLIVAAPPA